MKYVLIKAEVRQKWKASIEEFLKHMATISKQHLPISYKRLYNRICFHSFQLQVKAAGLFSPSTSTNDMFKLTCTNESPAFC